MHFPTPLQGKKCPQKSNNYQNTNVRAYKTFFQLLAMRMAGAKWLHLEVDVGLACVSVDLSLCVLPQCACGADGGVGTFQTVCYIQCLGSLDFENLQWRSDSKNVFFLAILTIFSHVRFCSSGRRKLCSSGRRKSAQVYIWDWAYCSVEGFVKEGSQEKKFVVCLTISSPFCRTPVWKLLS